MPSHSMRSKSGAVAAAVLFIAGFLSACGGGGGGSTSPAPGGITAPVKQLYLSRSSVTDGAQGLDPRQKFEFLFSGPLASPGPGSEQVQLSDGTSLYPVTIQVNGATMMVTPVAPLRTGTEFSLAVKPGISGADGSVLQSEFVIKFKTVAAVYEPRQLTPPDNSVFGSGMPRIIVADVNNDGRPDLVELAALRQADHPNGYTLNIFAQDAAGAFSKMQKLEWVINRTPYSIYHNNVIALDIDSDGRPEILVPELASDSETTSGIRVFKVGSDGKFVARDFISTDYTETLAVFDVNGDGRPDLVGSNRRAVDQVTGGFQVLLGTSTGLTKLAPVQLPFGGYEFGVIDLDQDGKRELVVNRNFAKPGNGPMTNELLIYSQGNAGVFALNAALTAESAGFCAAFDICTDLRVADLNVDGKPELVFASTSAGAGLTNLLVAFNRQPGVGLSKTLQLSLGSGGVVVDIRDMNADKVPDLLLVGSDLVAQSNFFAILASPGLTPAYLHRTNIPVFDTMYPHNIAVADIDRDGQLDIVFDSYNSGIVLERRTTY